MCEGKKKSIMARSICCSVYILKDHYLYWDLNVSINAPERSLQAGERLSFLESRGNSIRLHATGSRLLVARAFPNSCKESQPTILVQRWGNSKRVLPFWRSRVLPACPTCVWDGGLLAGQCWWRCGGCVGGEIAPELLNVTRGAGA